MPKQAVLAIGGNLGDRVATLDSAVAAIGAHPDIKVLKRSPNVESVALTEAGLDDSLPAYLNGVVLISTTLKPKKLLDALRQIESDHGRVRLERWGSRTLDIDIVAYEGVIKASKHLTIPHPRAHERAFVLVPWSMIEPAAVLPGYGPIANLIEDLSEKVKVLA
jgi:2-amino-4-hydroxy-6-hydroxymethyldihydropteridine diphosphokinase